jgi:hypothetical protein
MSVLARVLPASLLAFALLLLHGALALGAQQTSSGSRTGESVTGVILVVITALALLAIVGFTVQRIRKGPGDTRLESEPDRLA